MKGDLSNLDVLRSVAVIAVAVSHFYAYFGGGQLSVFMRTLGFSGVCFFFVHTSLVLLASIERYKGTHLISSFYVRRALRIYPLCWVSILVALSTGLTDTTRQVIASLKWKGVLYNLLLVQNVSHSESIIGSLWSLPWEVQMYIVLPFLYAFAKKSANPPLFSLKLWVIAAAGAVASSLLHVPRSNWTTFPPLFLGGLVAYSFLRKGSPRIPSFIWPVTIISLLVCRCLVLRDVDVFAPQDVVANCVTCVLVGIAIPLYHELRSQWIVIPAKQIAKYSYGIYLFHIPVLAFMFGRFHAPLIVQVILYIVFTGAVSVVAYHCIEHPCIALGGKVTSGFETRRAPVTLCFSGEKEN